MPLFLRGLPGASCQPGQASLLVPCGSHSEKAPLPLRALASRWVHVKLPVLHAPHSFRSQLLPELCRSLTSHVCRRSRVWQQVGEQTATLFTSPRSPSPSSSLVSLRLCLRMSLLPGSYEVFAPGDPQGTPSGVPDGSELLSKLDLGSKGDSQPQSIPETLTAYERHSTPTAMLGVSWGSRKTSVAILVHLN